MWIGVNEVYEIKNVKVIHSNETGMQRKKMFLILIGVLIASFKAHAQTYPVAWTELQNVTVNADNSLAKTTPTGVWDATAASENVLAPGTDGYIQLTYNGSTVPYYMLGFARLNNDPNYPSIEYAIYMKRNLLYIYESGTPFGPFATMVAGDVLKVSREGNTIKYYHNSTVVRTATVANNQQRFRVDISINTGPTLPIVASFRPTLAVKATIQNPAYNATDGSITLQPEGYVAPVTYSWSSGETTSSISNKGRGIYTVTVTDGLSRTVTKSYSLGYAAGWTHLYETQVNTNNTITRTNPVAGWSGAGSSNAMPGGTNSWIEFVFNDPSTSYMVGYSLSDGVRTYTNLNYSWYVATTGIIYIYEGVSNRGVFGDVAKGDVFRIERSATTVKYFLNGVEKRSVALTSTAPMFMGCSVGNNTGSSAIVSTSHDKQLSLTADVVLPNTGNTGGSITPTIKSAYPPVTYQWSTSETTKDITNKPRGVYTLTVTDGAGRTVTRPYNLGYPVQWTDLTDIVVDANGVMTSGNTNLWSSAAASANILEASTNGYVEHVVNNLSNDLMFGLASINADVPYASINYAFYTEGTSRNLYIREAGVSKLTLLPLVKGDVLRIAREGSNIVYYRNGVNVKTTANALTSALMVDVCLDLGTLDQMTCSFTRTPRTFYSIGNGIWTNPSIWSTTPGGASIGVYPTAIDAVNIQGNTVTINTGIYCANLNITANTSTTQLKVDGTSAAINVKGEVTLEGASNTAVQEALIIQNGGKINVTNP